MNLEATIILTSLFFLIGAHHYIKHEELEGMSRFMQYHDIWNVVKYTLKAHEGWQMICLLLALAAMLF